MTLPFATFLFTRFIHRPIPPLCSTWLWARASSCLKAPIKPCLCGKCAITSWCGLAAAGIRWQLGWPNWRCKFPASPAVRQHLAVTSRPGGAARAPQCSNKDRACHLYWMVLTVSSNSSNLLTHHQRLRVSRSSRDLDRRCLPGPALQTPCHQCRKKKKACSTMQLRHAPPSSSRLALLRGNPPRRLSRLSLLRHPQYSLLLSRLGK